MVRVGRGILGAIAFIETGLDAIWIGMAASMTLTFCALKAGVTAS
jgi:hypothetical protein